MSRFIGYREVLRDPHGVAEYVRSSSDLYGLAGVDVRVDTPHMVCLWFTLEPWAAMASEGFPVERVAITVFRGGRIVAVPVGARGRSWAHRFAFQFGNLEALGELCLWYPGDPPALKWAWTDGFVEYVTIVHRHLLAEEFCRRHGRWPAEDAPHGAGDHPIRSAKLREVVSGIAA